MAEGSNIVIMGVFVADVTFRASRLPNMGETLVGSQFSSGPGGKGSNQSVAAARAGGRVSFFAKIGDDTFGEMAKQTWSDAGVVDKSLTADIPTGAAMIFVNDKTGDNAIILVQSAGGTLSPDDVDLRTDAIKSAKVFVTQFEQPFDSAKKALGIAKEAGCITVLNPAPAPEPVDKEIFSLCDFVTPNESEAEGLTGIKVETEEEAKRAADKLLSLGAKCVMLTLGERGVLVHDGDTSEMVPSYDAGPVAETTGAGDAFNGALAVALAEGKGLLDSARFACACAAISVTRPGTAPSMPSRGEIDELLSR